MALPANDNEVGLIDSTNDPYSHEVTLFDSEAVLMAH